MQHLVDFIPGGGMLDAKGDAHETGKLNVMRQAVVDLAQQRSGKRDIQLRQFFRINQADISGRVKMYESGSFENA